VAAVLERERADVDAVLAPSPTGTWSRDRDAPVLRRALRTLRCHIYLEGEYLFPLLQRR
jgi:hypothetical protein